MSKSSRLADYLEHMQQAAEQACSFVEGMDQTEFFNDRRTQNAVVMSLVIVGEAATKITNDHVAFVQAHPQIPWPSVRGMRNRMVHGYFDINLEVVWNTLQSALPDLSRQIQAIRDELQKSP
jgi:uncharacterized protein with HEPN domain